MNKVYLGGEVVKEIDWNIERFNSSAIHAVGKCLFQFVDLLGRKNSLKYAVALAAILGYLDYEAWPIGESFGDIELKQRGESC